MFETKVINWIISLYIISYSAISLEIGMMMMFYFNGLKLLAGYLIRKKVDWIVVTDKLWQDKLSENNKINTIRQLDFINNNSNIIKKCNKKEIGILNLSGLPD